MVRESNGNAVMSFECSQCERDLRGGHADDCPVVTGEYAKKELKRLHQLIHNPQLNNFSEAVVLEAVHQRERWGSEHDAGKNPEDWFWLVGYLAGKALHAQRSGNIEKALHHTISASAALANWHAIIN